MEDGVYFRNWSTAGTAHNKPRTITRDNGNRSEFFYAPDRARYQQIIDDGQGAIDRSKVITYIGGLYERHAKANGVVEHRHQFQAGGQTIAIYTSRSNGANDLRYLHRDHLGSVDVITDEAGDEVERFAYDAHGKRRALAWTADSSDDLLDQAHTTARGFTGHEHLDHLGLIHMNGRVFDPILGRFTSADPHIQFADNTQSYNRYSYVLGNLLSATDPSGFFLSKLVKKVKRYAKKAYKAAVKYGTRTLFVGFNGAQFLYLQPVRRQFQKSQTLQSIGRVASSYFGGPVGAAGFEAYLADIDGASFGEALVASGVAFALNGGQAGANSNGRDFGTALRNGTRQLGSEPRSGRSERTVDWTESRAMANAVGNSEDHSGRSSLLDNALSLFRDRVSVSAKLRAGVGPAVEVGPSVNHKDLVRRGSIRVDPGVGEGLGASAALTVDVQIIRSGRAVVSPFITNHTLCVGIGPGGCISASFFDDRIFSLSLSGGLVGGLSFTNTIARPEELRVFPAP